jgi:exodeoxyribonuclease VII small subunit
MPPESHVSASRKALNFEKSLSELETLIERMEQGELSLEESLKSFEQGIRLTQQCQEALSQAQQRVQLLTQQDGEPRLAPLAGADDEEADDEAEH